MQETSAPAKILVADDLMANVLVAKKALQKHGYAVVMAGDGAEALEKVAAEQPDLVILDVIMPKMNGFEVCRKLRAQEETKLLPIVMVTALNDSAARVEGIRAGADDFLSKPFNWQELLARVTSLMNLRETRMALQRERNRLQLLYDVSRELNTNLSLDQILIKVVSATGKVLGASKGMVMLLDSEGKAQYKIMVRQKPSYQPVVTEKVTEAIIDRGLVGWVLKQEQGTIVYDTIEDERWVVLPDDVEKTRSALVVPLLKMGEVVGVLMFVHDAPNYFDEGHLALLKSIAAQATISIQNAQLFIATQEERGQLAAVLNSTADMVIVTDEGLHIQQINPAAERMFGATSASCLEQPVNSVVTSAELGAAFERAAEENQVQVTEAVTSEQRTLYASVSPVKGVGYVAVMQDITALKELERVRLTAEQEKQKQIRGTFERYVSPELVDRILEDKQSFFDRRERKTAVVLFADLRGFTRMTATFHPDMVVDVLRQFFTQMTRVVYKHRGTIFDLAGDELMVGFGVPFEQENATELAVHTAREMQDSFTEIRQLWIEERGIDIGLGIGINRGTAVMGNVGSETHMKFALVGDVVNTAHRLVEIAQHGEVIISQTVYETLNDAELLTRFDALPPVKLKGKDAPESIYRLVSG